MDAISKTFEMTRGRLVQSVAPRRGQPYVHRCDLDVFKDVAWAIEANGMNGVTTGELWDAMPDHPRTQISVALDFLKERGCVMTEGRRSFPASSTLFEDAMIEWHALEE